MFKTLVIAVAFLLLRSTALGYEPILVQISSGENACNKEQFFGKFSLNQVSQFGATCDIPIPNKNQVDFLLKDNVIPILCMGVYDVSLRLCNSASDNIAPFSDIFPPTKEKFTTLFERLENEDGYSSLEKFCSFTVINQAVQVPSSNLTNLWWNVLNEHLRNNSCFTTCRTSEKNKVHPLCSYIVWSNGVYLNYQKNQLESRGPGGEEGDFKTTSNSLQPNHSADNSQLVKDKDGTPQAEVANSAANTTLSGPGNTEPHGLPQETVAEHTAVVESSVEPQNKVPTVNLESPITHEEKRIRKGKVSKKRPEIKVQDVGVNVIPIVSGVGEETKGNVGIDDTNPAPPQQGVGSSDIKSPAVKQDVDSNEMKIAPPQEDVGSSDVNLTPPQNVGSSDTLGPPQEVGSDTNIAAPQDVGSSNVDLTSLEHQPKIEKTGDPMAEGDFEFEPTPDGIGMDQPVDKHYYSGEDGDGDDVDTEPEGVKNTPNKTGADKPSLTRAEEGVRADPEHMSGEVEKIQMNSDPFVEAEDSHFFPYFLGAAGLTIMVYLVSHNKKKLVALAIEGRKTRGSRRRPNCSNYSKLDCNLEEAMVSNTTASVTHVLY